jgi:hypothetical protein
MSLDLENVVSRMTEEDRIRVRFELESLKVREDVFKTDTDKALSDIEEKLGRVARVIVEAALCLSSQLDEMVAIFSKTGMVLTDELSNHIIHTLKQQIMTLIYVTRTKEQDKPGPQEQEIYKNCLVMCARATRHKMITRIEMRVLNGIVARYM